MGIDKRQGEAAAYKVPIEVETPAPAVPYRCLPVLTLDVARTQTLGLAGQFQGRRDEPTRHMFGPVLLESFHPPARANCLVHK